MYDVPASSRALNSTDRTVAVCLLLRPSSSSSSFGFKVSWHPYCYITATFWSSISLIHHYILFTCPGQVRYLKASLLPPGLCTTQNHLLIPSHHSQFPQSIHHQLNFLTVSILKAHVLLSPGHDFAHMDIFPPCIAYCLLNLFIITCVISASPR